MKLFKSKSNIQAVIGFMETMKQLGILKNTVTNIKAENVQVNTSPKALGLLLRLERIEKFSDLSHIANDTIEEHFIFLLSLAYCDGNNFISCPELNQRLTILSNKLGERYKTVKALGEALKVTKLKELVGDHELITTSEADAVNVVTGLNYLLKLLGESEYKTRYSTTRREIASVYNTILDEHRKGTYDVSRASKGPNGEKVTKDMNRAKTAVNDKSLRLLVLVSALKGIKETEEFLRTKSDVERYGTEDSGVDIDSGDTFMESSMDIDLEEIFMESSVDMDSGDTVTMDEIEQFANKGLISSKKMSELEGIV